MVLLGSGVSKRVKTGHGTKRGGGVGCGGVAVTARRELGFMDLIIRMSSVPAETAFSTGSGQNPARKK